MENRQTNLFPPLQPSAMRSSMLATTAEMATKVPTSNLARRGLVYPNLPIPCTRRSYSQYPPARRRCLFQRSGPTYILTGRRALSNTPLRKFADVDDSLDFRQQDRESDEVDVCIVGGGISPVYSYDLLY